MHAYIDSNNIRHNYIVLNQIRELSSKDEKIPDEIFDYEKYKSPKWALEEQQDNVKMEDNSNNIDNLSNHKSKFTL